jgi:hypothetical protein
MNEYDAATIVIGLLLLLVGLGYTVYAHGDGISD